MEPCAENFEKAVERRERSRYRRVRSDACCDSGDRGWYGSPYRLELQQCLLQRRKFHTVVGSRLLNPGPRYVSRLLNRLLFLIESAPNNLRILDALRGVPRIDYQLSFADNLLIVIVRVVGHNDDAIVSP
jgi:hypothetical protein